ncbi:MAG: hypothetical protein L0177_03480 [Chloroflexi bacterium]|nr:hypothetical protein [Chloroflexota bacterium]
MGVVPTAVKVPGLTVAEGVCVAPASSSPPEHAASAKMSAKAASHLVISRAA